MLLILNPGKRAGTGQVSSYLSEGLLDGPFLSVSALGWPIFVSQCSGQDTGQKWWNEDNENADLAALASSHTLNSGKASLVQPLWITDAGVQASENSSSSSVLPWTTEGDMASLQNLICSVSKQVCARATSHCFLEFIYFPCLFWGVNILNMMLIFSWLRQILRWLPNWMGLLTLLSQQAQAEHLRMKRVMPPFCSFSQFIRWSTELCLQYISPLV